MSACYSEILLKNENLNEEEKLETEGAYFSIHDLDSDVIPELVIAGGDGTYHASGYYNILTYNKERLINNLLNFFSEMPYTQAFQKRSLQI